MFYEILSTNGRCKELMTWYIMKYIYDMVDISKIFYGRPMINID